MNTLLNRAEQSEVKHLIAVSLSLFHSNANSLSAWWLNVDSKKWFIIPYESISQRIYKFADGSTNIWMFYCFPRWNLTRHGIKTRRWIKSLKCCSNSRFQINNRCIIVKNTSLHVYFWNAERNVYPRCGVKGNGNVRETIQHYILLRVPLHGKSNETDAKWTFGLIFTRKNIHKDSNVNSLDDFEKKRPGWNKCCISTQFIVKPGQ